MFSSLQSLFDPWLLFLADDPMLRLMQLALLFLGCVAIFLVFFATRDILLRTHSFPYMFFCILLVALLPGIGFLLYLLIRPARTLKDREVEEFLRELLKGREKHGMKPKKEIGKEMTKEKEKPTL